MSEEKNLILISYIDSLNLGYKPKAEFSTNDSDTKVIVVQIAPRYEASFV